MIAPDVLSLPAPYYLFRLLTGSDHMHFGWFRSTDEHPGTAQENMMELNMFFRPARLERVLDVGAGLGATARWLSRRGIAVTSISPDAPLIEYARLAAAGDQVPHAVQFHVSPFESFQWTGSFDWVLFQESFQYFDDVEATIARAHAALRPGGRLHIGDQFSCTSTCRASRRASTSCRGCSPRRSAWAWRCTRSVTSAARRIA